MFVNVLKYSSSPFILISSLQRSTTLLTLFLSFLKIDCLHVSFTAYENFYILSKMHCLLVLVYTFYPSEVSEDRNPTIKHISTYTLVLSSISTYVVDRFLVIFSHNYTFVSAKDLGKCEPTNFPNKILVRLSVCLS